MKQIIIKVITLITFVGLISSFVIYRVGMLDNIIQHSPNGGVINTAKTIDTTNDSIKKPAIFSSSKSIILTDKKIPSKYNKLSKKPINSSDKIIKSSERIRLDLMSSSKSIQLYEHKYNFYQYIHERDSLKSKTEKK